MTFVTLVTLFFILSREKKIFYYIYKGLKITVTNVTSVTKRCYGKEEMTYGLLHCQSQRQGKERWGARDISGLHR